MTDESITQEDLRALLAELRQARGESLPRTEDEGESIGATIGMATAEIVAAGESATALMIGAAVDPQSGEIAAGVVVVPAALMDTVLALTIGAAVSGTVALSPASRGNGGYL